MGPGSAAWPCMKAGQTHRHKHKTDKQLATEQTTQTRYKQQRGQTAVAVALLSLQAGAHSQARTACVKTQRLEEGTTVLATTALTQPSQVSNTPAHAAPIQKRAAAGCCILSRCTGGEAHQLQLCRCFPGRAMLWQRSQQHCLQAHTQEPPAGRDTERWAAFAAAPNLPPMLSSHTSWPVRRCCCPSSSTHPLWCSVTIVRPASHATHSNALTQ